MKKLAPYQIFFPLGLLNALLSVGVWLAQDLGWFASPALMIHSKLVIGGFLWSFIAGFLMTAIPRMTGAAGANREEYFFAASLLLGQTVFAWWLDPRFFYGNQMLLTFFLILYGGRRVLVSTKPIPVFFSHVALGMLLALGGSYYHFLGNSFMGIHLYHIGAPLLLILGIGTRFFSFLSGLPSEFENVTAHWLRILFHGSGALTAVLLVLAGHEVTAAYAGLALVTLAYLLGFWRVQRSSDRPSPLKHGVRIVAAMIPISFFLTWLQPLMFITWFHLLFVGCFGLITFAVATRVTLAHGSYSLDLEMKSPALWFLISFLVLGVISRVTYGFSEGVWKAGCLRLAAGFWILAVGGWCWTFLPRIFKPGPQAAPAC